MRDRQFVILCVDDDPDILEGLKLFLTSKGYLCVTAGGAEEGVKKYTAEQPDLVIVDLMMEEIDSGTKLVQQLLALGNKAPVYMLSAAGDTMSMTTDTTALGLAGVFQKPIKFDKLALTLDAKLKTA